MAGLPVDDAGRVQAGLVLLGNAALVADGVDPSDATEARAVLERVAATLSLGLCELSANDPTAAAGILLEVAFNRIFQVGFTQTLKLQWAAEKAPWAAPLRLPGTDALLLDSPEREVFAAVVRKRPLFPGALDAPGAPDRPFRTPLDIATVRVSIEQSITLAKASWLSGVVPEEVVKGYEPHLGLHPLASLHFSDLYLTALARSLAGGAWLNAPLFLPRPPRPCGWSSPRQRRAAQGGLFRRLASPGERGPLHRAGRLRSRPRLLGPLRAPPSRRGRPADRGRRAPAPGRTVARDPGVAPGGLGSVPPARFFEMMAP